ncbi:MAG: MBL fold metallo-hydrolase [Anaerofustis sp.]
MPKKTFVTNMPDKSGAFMTASKIISKHSGNIVRVSYNKAVDLHTLFLDVEAEEPSLDVIAKELSDVGYLNEKIPETRVIVVAVRIPDIPGALLPVLKILDRYDINISYINSTSTHAEYQNFVMGLLIEKPSVMKLVLDEISELYQINIMDYDESETVLDNTIFYIRLANDMQKLLGLSAGKTMEFIGESNRILQVLQDKGKDAEKVFDYIRRFAGFIAKYRGEQFSADIEKIQIGAVTLYSIQPPCGSNTYLLSSPEEESMIVIDTGFAIYRDEMQQIFVRLFSDWNERRKSIYITHADVDHCGLLGRIPNAEVYMNRKSAQNIRRQYNGLPDFREEKDLCFGYSKLSQIVSGYLPMNPELIRLIDEKDSDDHEDLTVIGMFSFGDLNFSVLEGNGGHLYGEMIFYDQSNGLMFSGDNLVNISGFSADRAEFNSFAPYLMTSVNIDSKKASATRNALITMLEGKETIVCGGHGPISMQKNGALITLHADRIL